MSAPARLISLLSTLTSGNSSGIVTCDLDIVTFFRQFYLAFHTPTCGGYHANSWRAVKTISANGKL